MEAVWEKSVKLCLNREESNRRRKVLQFAGSRKWIVDESKNFTINSSKMVDDITGLVQSP